MTPFPATPAATGRHSRTRRALLGSLAGLAGTAAAGALAACGANPANTAGGGEAAASAKSKQPVTIRLGERAGTEKQAFDARLPAFKEQFPYVTVQREEITGDMIVALQTMAASNTLPDNAHAYTGGNQYHNFALGGAFRQIDSMIARDKLDLKGWFPEMIEIMKIDGKLYGLPFKGQVLAAGFYYNVNLFKARGLAEPNDNWTLDDLVKAAQQLTIRQGNDTVQWGYAINSITGENFTPSVRQWGGDTYAENGKKAALDTPAVLEGLQWYENLLQRERVMHPLADSSNDFIQGKIAMFGRSYFNYKSTLLPQVGDKFKWDGAMMPKHPKTGKRGGMFAGDSHAITRDSKAPDAAFELCKFVCDKEFGVALGLQTSGSTTLGGRPDVYADSRILNAPQYSKQMQKAQLDSVSQIKEPFSTAANFRGPDIEKVRDPAVTAMLNGEKKVEAGALKTLNAELQNVLNMGRA
jgi:multiple sugar transport system substrate-binding protein